MAQQRPPSNLAIPAFQSEPVDLSAITPPSFTSEPVDLQQKSLGAQLADMFGSTLQQVNPFPSLMKANTEVATVLQTAIEGRLQEAGARALDDLKTLGSGLATMLNLPTEARSEIYNRGVQAFQQGDAPQAAAHFTSWMLPLIGPAMSEGANEVAAGNWGKAAGIGIGQGLNLGVGPAMNIASKAARVGVPAAALPAEAIHGGNLTRADLGASLKPAVSMPASELAIPISEKVAFADENQIPITAGTRANSKVLKSLQQGNAATSFVSEKIDEAGAAAQADRMQAVGRDMARGLAPAATPDSAGSMAQHAGELAQRQALELGVKVEGAYDRAAAGIANRVAPRPVSMYEAGQQQVAELEDVADQFAQKAKGHYDAVRDGSKAYAEDVVVGYEDSPMLTSAGQPAYRQPIVKSVDFPINITKEQADIASLYGKLKNEWPIAQQQNSAGFKALENLSQSGPVLALEELEDALGAVKSIVRKASGRSQGLAKLVVSKLEQAIARSVREADAEHLLDELRAGRAATAKKYEVLELVGSLNTEPAKAAAMLTQFGDKGAELLQGVTSVAPQASRALARAVLQSLFDSMMDNGRLSLDKAAAAGNRWGQIGDITKRVLFTNAETRAQIDRFFQQAARASRQRVAPNLRESAVGAFDSLVQRRDVNVHQLQALARVAPDLPQMLGRAWFDERLDRLFAKKGTMSKSGTLMEEFRQLGPRTRRLIFGSQERQIRTFLELAEDEAFVGNTSRTAYMSHLVDAITVHAPVIFFHNPMALGAAASLTMTRAGFAAMMWDKGASEALIAALRTPVTAKTAATVAAARVLNQAKRLGVPVESIPTAAKAGAAATNVVKGNFGAPMAAEQQQEQPAPTAQAPTGTQIGRFMVSEESLP